MGESSHPEGATGYTTCMEKSSGVHYENIYESIDVNLQNSNTTAEGQYNNTTSTNNMTDKYNYPGPSNSNYDVPRSYKHMLLNDRMAQNYPSNNTLPFHAQHPAIKKKTDEVEYANTKILNLDEKYENLYDPLRKLCPRTTVYGRLDIIGHGFGRIERHLSSSCGNIDHYSLANSSTGSKHTHEASGERLYANIQPQTSQNLSKKNKNCDDVVTNRDMSPPSGSSQASASRKSTTGTIPKIKTLTLLKKTKRKSEKESQYVANNQNSDLLFNNDYVNDISNSSNNWVLLNKWLPLWVANSNSHNQYNIMDLNLMFSRQCDCHLMHCHGSNSVIQYSACDNLDNYETIDAPYRNEQLPEDEPSKNNQGKTNSDENSRSNDLNVPESSNKPNENMEPQNN